MALHFNTVAMAQRHSLASAMFITEDVAISLDSSGFNRTLRGSV